MPKDEYAGSRLGFRLPSPPTACPHLVLVAHSNAETTALLGPGAPTGGGPHASDKPSVGWPLILRGGRSSTRTAR